MPPIDAPKTQAFSIPKALIAPAVSSAMLSSVQSGSRAFLRSITYTVKSFAKQEYAAFIAGADSTMGLAPSPGRMTKGILPSPKVKYSSSPRGVFTVPVIIF